VSDLVSALSAARGPNAGARLITVLLNSAAGRAQSEERCARVTELFAAAGVDAQIVLLPSGAHAAAAAREAADAGACAIVAGGGDGTVSAVASVVVGTDRALGVLPLGTLNHFAKDAGIPLDLESAVATIVAGHTRRVDTGEVNGQTFVNNASIGIYPDIVVERERLRQLGHRKWIALAIASARILRRYRGLVMRLAAGDTTERARTAFLFVGNNEYHVDGLSLGSRDRLDGNQLFAYFAPRVHTRELPKLLTLALAGRARERNVLESIAATELHVDTPGRRRLRVGVDGEVIVMRVPLHVFARPASLRVIVPAA
jgi:diacylglycerol kinase family enzyme